MSARYAILIVPGAKDAYEQMFGNPRAAASKTAQTRLAPDHIYLLRMRLNNNAAFIGPQSACRRMTFHRHRQSFRC